MGLLFDRRWRRYSLGMIAVVCLAAFAVIFWCAYGSSSMRPVTVFVQNLKGQGVMFTVPAAYFKNAQNGRVATSMWIEAAYPDMGPYRLLTREQREKLKPGEYWMSIQVHATNTSQIVQAIFARKVNVETLAFGNSVPGFEVYRDRYAGKINEYLVPETSAGGSGSLERVMDCGPYLDDTLTTRFSGICWAYVQPSDGFYLRYGIARDHLPRWQEVERKALDLLRQFDMRCYHDDLQEGEEPVETQPCELYSLSQ